MRNSYAHSYSSLRYPACRPRFCWPPRPAIHAEEGMWTFDNPPLKQLAAKYNFHPTPGLA